MKIRPPIVFVISDGGTPDVLAECSVEALLGLEEIYKIVAPFDPFVIGRRHRAKEVSSL